MNALTIKDPADLLSFIGHTLGFWPEENLVCITLDNDKVGATLRIDLPKQPGHEIHFARTVASYLTTDEQATGIVFALYTAQQAEKQASPGHTVPRSPPSRESSPRKASPSATASTSVTPRTPPMTHNQASQ